MRPAKRTSPCKKSVTIGMAALLLIVLLPGNAVASQASDAQPSSPASPDPCRHPFPCGELWPKDLTGPFELDRVEPVRVKSHDGVELTGWVGLPKLPDGVKAPVALHSTPYMATCYWLAVAEAGECDPTPATAAWWSDNPPGPAWSPWGVNPIELIRHGYAAAFFNVRGTGTSGGCYDFLGHHEQADQKVLIDWVAHQEWSSGRVAMGGISAPGSTTIAGATTSNDVDSPLKAVIAGAPIMDPYTFNHTPQGAVWSNTQWFWPLWITSVAVFPAVGGGAQYMADQAEILAERACPEVIDVLTQTNRGWATDEGSESFWSERRLIDDLPGVSAAVLAVQGFYDRLGHAFQDAAWWEALAVAPKRQITGPWFHQWPTEAATTFDPSWHLDDWESLVFGWLDYWLKGIGDPGHLRLGFADYQDDTGTWRSSRAWPAQQARDEVIYLAGESVATEPGEGQRTFRSVPDIRNTYWPASEISMAGPWASLCSEAPAAAAEEGIHYIGEPLSDALVVAGNPHAYIRVSTDQPGGIVALGLVELKEGFTCDETARPRDIELLAAGAADLRHWNGDFVGQDFPRDTPTNVRIDLWNLANRIEKGSRVAVVVSGSAGPFGEWWNARHHPNITIHSDGGDLASHVVLPLVEGSFGGKKPTVDYPPRPFV